MVQERVAENVYLFTSDLYAQVNAGAVVGPDWSILIDTLAFPEETLEIKDFLENRLSAPVRYVINTHYHSDHSMGTCWFPSATVVSHALCRDLLDTVGREALATAKKQSRELKDVEVVLPDLVFERGELLLKVGKRTLRLIHLPGHSMDNVGVLVVEDKVLFAGDIMMPIPYIVDGDMNVMIDSMKRIPPLKLENLIQGHGDVILRGEVGSSVKDNLTYLSTIRRHVKKASSRSDPEAYLRSIDVESCGKARILLNGLVEQLHQRNMQTLYERTYADEDE
jgi:glyoxylase-like metal-dependent hydrolase (beta-lactamase superfamily II)